MARDTVADRGAMIYAYLRTRQDRPLTIAELSRRFRIVNGDTTRRALRVAAELARADGLCLRVACPSNGFTLSLTDRPEEIVDAATWLGQTAAGVIRRARKHTDVMRARLGALAPGPERDRIEQYLRLHGIVEAAAEAAQVEGTRLAAERRAARAAAA